MARVHQEGGGNSTLSIVSDRDKIEGGQREAFDEVEKEKEIERGSGK